MKAIRINQFGAPEVMKLESINNPIPEKEQVLVQVKAAGVNPYETYMRAGKYDKKPALPYTPGSDCAGVVAETGPGVTSIKKGDRVYTAGSLTGTYAEYVLCSESQIHPLPDNISFAQGAGIGVPYGTAYYALFRLSHAAASETVLIHGGSGGVGIAGIQLARAAGLSVIATAGSDRGKELIANQGVKYVLDHTDTSRFERIMSITGNHGVDVILEMLANINLANDLKVLAVRGRAIIIGSRGSAEIDPRQLMTKEALVMGMILFNVSEPDLKIIHAGIVAGLANKTLNPVVGQEFPLSEAPLSHTRIMEPGSFGKIVLIP
jgi:NADPH2:quinone reductase